MEQHKNPNAAEIRVAVSAETKNELQAIMDKLIASSQLPQGVTLEMFAQMILQNYVQSSKAMEKMGGAFLANFKDKIESALGGESGSPDGFYKAMMEGFSGAFGQKSEAKPEEKKPDADFPGDKIKKS